MFEHTRTMTSFAADDIPEAQRFYGETLGLKVSGMSGALLLHLADGHDTLIYPRPGHIPASYTVLNFEAEDVDEAVEALVARGVRFLRYEEPGADAHGVVRGPERDIAWFTDPAGNIHSVFQPKAPAPQGSA